MPAAHGRSEMAARRSPPQAEAGAGGPRGCTAGVGAVLPQEGPNFSKCKTESQAGSGPTWVPFPSPLEASGLSGRTPRALGSLLCCLPHSLTSNTPQTLD